MKNIKPYKFTKILKIAILTTILLTPLYIIRWAYGPLPTTLLEHLIGITIIIWLIELISYETAISATRPDDLTIQPFNPASPTGRHLAIWKNWSKQVVLLLLLILSCLLSLVRSPDLRGGLGVIKAYFVEPIIFFYLLTNCLKRQIIRKKEIIWAITGSALWLSVMGILQVIINWPIFASHEVAAGRAHAVFKSGNALALYLGPSIMLLLNEILDSTKRGKRAKKGRKLKAKKSGAAPLTGRLLKTTNIKIIILALLILAFFLTKSTGGLIGLGVGLAFLAAGRLLSLKLFRKLVIAGAVIYLAGHLVFFALLPKLTPQVDNPWERPGGTGLTRLCVWEGTLNLLKDSPILGAGLSGFKELYSAKYFTCDAEPLEYPHNFILNFWTETGLLGLIAIMSIISLTFYKELNQSEKKGINWGVLSALIYLLVHGLVDVPYFKNDLAVMFWVILALNWTTPEERVKGPPEADGSG